MTKPCYLRTLICISIMLICSFDVFANDYQIAYDHNPDGAEDWHADDMLVSPGGNYEYFESTSTPEFWFDIEEKSSGDQINASDAIIKGFNGTDLTNMGGDETCYVDDAPAHYYIIVWLPNTPFNSGSDPVICASTTLPDDTTPLPCEAPDHVNITGRWDRFGGETISLTATAYDDEDNEIDEEDITSWQWQKLEGTTWTDVPNGAAGGVTISGATTKNLQIANCGYGNSGKYRCVVSTGAACSTASATETDGSEGFGVKVYVLECYNGGTTVSNFTRVGDTQAGTLQIDLSANTTYTFKVHADNDYYGNNGIVNEDVTNWVLCNSGAEVCTTNLRVNSGLGGTFTFSMEYSTSGNSDVEGEPEISVTYPRKTIYLTPNSDWKSNNAKFAIYYFRKVGDDLYGHGWTDFMDTYVCNDNIYVAEIPQWNGVKVVAARINGSSVTPSFDDGVKWNQTDDIVVTSNDHITITGWDKSQTYTTFAPPTYSISFANGGGTGSMSGLTGISCEGDQALTVNTFTKSSSFFAYWTADVDVTVGNVTITAGDPIANGATLQNITSNIALTANWTTRVNIPGTVDRYTGATFSSGMTWYGERDEYFDFGPTDAINTDRWVEWPVHLTASGEYIITEEYFCTSGRGWQFQLLDGERNVVSTYSTGNLEGNVGTVTYNTKWNLSSVPVADYTLRVTNVRNWARPKLKSLTISYFFSYAKIPDRPLYGDEKDSHRAVGTINNATVVIGFSSPPTGEISVDGRTLTIGSETVTAPETEKGRLDNIPYDKPPGYTSASTIWRFDHWDITGGISAIKAVYIPTFAVEYDVKDGIINDDPYAHWYVYTGREEDYTPLPMNVTKDGLIFAGWYQTSTTQLFTQLPGHYYGAYAKSESCDDHSCDYRLKAHWIMDCDEAQVLSGVKLTGSGSSSYDVYGYNDEEYAGTPVVSVGSTYADGDPDNDDNTERGYKLETPGSDIVFATLKKGDFRAGDLVRVAITAPNTNREISNTTTNITLYYGTGTSDATILVNIQRIRTDTIVEYFLDADDISEMKSVHATGVGVFRETINGEDPCVYSVEIVGCRDLVFDDNHNTHVWSDPLNWGPTHSEIPDYYQATRIIRPCIVDIPNAHALNVKLCKEYEDRNGSLVINDTAGLEVTQRVSEVHGLDYSTLYPVQASDLVILSTASHQGALAHGDTENKTHATVEFYARGVVDINDWEHGTWQYMGVPFNDVTDAQEHYYGAWMAQWIEDTSGDINANWTWIAQYDALTPFAGYGLTQEAAKIYTNSGTLVPSSNQTLTLTASGSDYKGWNMFANSWMAPIRITQFNAADFGAAEQTIYLFNTGHNSGNQSTFGATTSAGQYIAVPINTAGSMDASYQYIAPMQGFYIMTETATSVTLNYDRLVRKSDHTALSVGPNRAPKMKNEEETTMPRIVIDVTGNRFSDRLYIFENGEQTNGFDNGWDGYKFEGDDYAPQLMTRTDDLDLAVDVSPSFEGKRIAFRAGEDEEYTLHFSTTENGLWIRDLITTAETEIAEENTYSFFASNTTSEDRFEIVDRRQAEEVITGFSEINESDGELIAQTVYTIDGRLVLKRTSNFNQPLRLPQTGVYLLELQTTAGTKIKKITF